MKKQNTQSKVIVALTAVVLLLVALSATLTFAYFTATNNASSTAMTFGTLSLTAPTASAAQVSATCGTPAHTLVPGCSITVSGGASVGGNIDALMRLKVTAEVYKTKKLNDNNQLANIVQGDTGAAQYVLVDNKVVAYTDSGTHFWAVKDDTAAASILTSIKAAAPTGWQVSGDYFYSTKLVSGTVQPAEFTSTFATSAAELGNDWQGAYVQFKVVAEAIQADHLVDGANNVVIAKDASTNAITSVKVGSAEAVTTAAAMFAAIADVDAWTVDLATGVAAQQNPQNP